MNCFLNFDYNLVSLFIEQSFYFEIDIANLYAGSSILNHLYNQKISLFYWPGP